MNQLIVFDTETSGFPNWTEPSGREDQPHIVQLAAHQVDVDNRKVIQTMNVIVKPEGWIIPQDTIDVHGITNEQAMDVGVSEKVAIEMFLELWGNRLRVAHNTTFDNRIIRIALKRYFGDEYADVWKEGEYQCTGLLSRPILGLKKMPSLEEAYKFFFGKELEGAHTALGDTNSCLDVYWAIKDHSGE